MKKFTIEVKNASGPQLQTIAAGAQDHEQCLDQVRPQDQNRWTRAASSKPQGAEPQAASCKQQASHNELISVI